MAIVVTHPTGSINIDDSNALSSYTTGSHTPTSGALYVICVTQYDLGDTATAPSSVTSTGGMTWTRVGTALAQWDTVASQKRSMTAYWAVGNGTTQTHTVTFPDVSDSGAMVYFLEITGADTSNPVVQASANQADASATASCSLGTFASEANAGIIFAQHDVNDATTYTAEAGWTELDEFGSLGASPGHMGAAWRIGTDTSPSMTLSAARDWGALAIEIRSGTPQDAVAPTPTVPGPAAWQPTVPAGGFGGHTDWPAINPQARPYQEFAFLPTNSVKDDHIAEVSARKIALVGIKVFRSTTQSINDATATSITYDSTTFSRDFAPVAATFTTVTVPYDGVYQLTGLIEFEANATGSRAVEFMVNGAAIDGSRGAATPGGVWRCSFSSSQRLTAGDTVGVRVTQNSGGALNVSAGVTNDALTVIYQGHI